VSRNEDFYGNDVIMLYAMSRNGIQDAQLPVVVEPINDPPMILAPKSIFLGGKESWEGYKVFDKNRDEFNFSVVEVDLRNYPGTLNYVYYIYGIIPSDIYVK
jgi:hypothetical protein